MGRPPLSRRATTLACLGSESGGGDSLRLAVMADVVGVVVSAFRFTPFFCDDKVNSELQKQGSGRTGRCVSQLPHLWSGRLPACQAPS